MNTGGIRVQKIESVEQFEQIVELGNPFLLLKHSVTCPISQAAYEEYEKFTGENPSLHGYYLTVQDARPLSNYIAEKYQVKHESPQAFLFSENGVAWNASHWNITTETLKKVTQENR
jgi:bacillithiol system protein YtxJ